MESLLERDGRHDLEILAWQRHVAACATAPKAADSTSAAAPEPREEIGEIHLIE